MISRWAAEVRRRLVDLDDAADSQREVGRLQERSRRAAGEVQREAVRARRTLRDAQQSLLEAGEEVGEALDRRRRG